MPERSKPPLQPRRVSSDDLGIEYQGQTYYPHAGEWVEFIGRPTVGLYLRLIDMGEGGIEAFAQLAKTIHAWSWTDDAGVAFKSPPGTEELLQLPSDELAWILRNSATAAPETNSKNGSTPSTSALTV